MSEPVKQVTEAGDETVTEAREYYWKIAVHQSEFGLRGVYGIERVFQASTLSLEEQQNPDKIPMLGKGDTIGMITDDDLQDPKHVGQVTLLYLFKEKRLPIYQRMILFMDNGLSGPMHGKERADIIFLGRYVDLSRRAEDASNQVRRPRRRPGALRSQLEDPFDAHGGAISRARNPADQDGDYDNPDRDYLHFSVVCGAPERKAHLVLARTIHSLYHFVLDHLKVPWGGSLSGWSEEEVLKKTYPLQTRIDRLTGVTFEASDHSLYNQMEDAVAGQVLVIE